MDDLTKKVLSVLGDSINKITKDPNHSLHDLISDNLITHISCNYDLCSDHLTKFSDVFNKLLDVSQKNNQKNIKAYILENENIFHEIESLFSHLNWSTNTRVKEFNVATHTTSSAKCTIDNKFYIIKCYDHFYYIYNTGTNECVMAVMNKKKALTMINILLLTPYLTYGDLYAVHGGLVSDGENNILLSNSSLGGKTTFAILFLANGWQIITEETTYITKNGKILNYNIRNYFNIRAGTYLEFKDFFQKINVVNDSFLTMKNIEKKELFELGKKEQMTIYFDALSKDSGDITTYQITHVLKVSIDKDQFGMIIEESSPLEGVDRFLELSLAPTVMLFTSLTNMTSINKKKRKEELVQIFKNVKSYTVSSSFDYKKNFDFLKQKINLTRTP